MRGVAQLQHPPNCTSACWISYFLPENLTNDNVSAGITPLLPFWTAHPRSRCSTPHSPRNSSNSVAFTNNSPASFHLCTYSHDIEHNINPHFWLVRMPTMSDINQVSTLDHSCGFISLFWLENPSIDAYIIFGISKHSRDDIWDGFIWIFSNIHRWIDTKLKGFSVAMFGCFASHPRPEAHVLVAACGVRELLSFTPRGHGAVVAHVEALQGGSENGGYNDNLATKQRKWWQFDKENADKSDKHWETIHFWGQPIFEETYEGHHLVCQPQGGSNHTGGVIRTAVIHGTNHFI